MSISFKLGQQLKEIRLNSGYQQKKLASELGIPASLLSMYEKGKREPSITFLDKFTRKFKITLSHLFSKIDQTDHQNSPKDFDTLLFEMKDLLNNLEKTSTR
jgi:transcriptional regulator with XRE-family HTH domain